LGEMAVEMTGDHMRMPAVFFRVQRGPAQDLGDEARHVARMVVAHVSEDGGENGVLADFSIKGVHQPVDGGHATGPLEQRGRRRRWLGRRPSGHDGVSSKCASSMRPGGFEPPTNSLEGCCSIHLSYGRDDGAMANLIVPAAP